MGKRHAWQHAGAPQTMLKRTTSGEQTETETTSTQKTKPKTQTETTQPNTKKIFQHSY
jgi:hypothetical protein